MPYIKGMEVAMNNHEPQATNHKPRTLYLIDGSGFIFRAYHAMPPLTNPEGVPVGAVYGFVNMLLKLTNEHPSDYMAVVFDAARKTFRNRLYSEYKAHRPPAPDDLIPQFALVREATRALALPAIELADYEADDIIATYAKKARAEGMNVVVVSSDKDLMQLIAPGVSMFDAMKQKTIGEEQVREKFGVGPDKVLEVLSLIGDSSDNVPGVPGIGPKTAAELINQYGDLENLLAHVADIKQPKRRETIMENADNARLSKQLVTLHEDVPALPPLDDLIVQTPDPSTLISFLQSHGFKSLVLKLQNKSSEFRVQSSEKIDIKKPNSTPLLPNSELQTPNSYTLVQDEATLAAWIAKARKKGLVAFDVETTSLNALQAELVGFSLCCEEGEACYVPLQHKALGLGQEALGKSDDLFSMPNAQSLTPGQIPLSKALALTKPLLEDASVLKIGHNIKFDVLTVQKYGILVRPIEDTMLLSYVLHAGEHGQGMDELAERYLNYKTITFDEVTGTGRERKRFDQVDIEKAGQYAAEDADVTLRFYNLFKPQVIANKMLALYETIERPLVGVLARMETAGIKVDREQLKKLSGDFARRLQLLEIDIHTLAGMKFNVGSPKQLGEVLFDALQLGGGKKSAKSGAYSTGNDVLEDLAEQGHAIAAKVIEWRQLSKLKSTYSDTLPEQIDPKTGRVHTSYAQAIASTGRLSSNDPNLQNIPIRTDEGKKIRCAFVAEEGYQLVSADYSQIELRLLAHMADIAPLKEAFRNGQDIHAITAGQMFGVPVDQVSDDLRRSAKTINFGIIYGMSAHGLATRLGIDRGVAAEYIKHYFAQYPGIGEYMETTKEFARTHGYVETLFGRRCHLPGINGKGPMRAFSERAAINAPLQGTAADIIKKAMIRISCELQSSCAGSHAAQAPAQPLRGSQDCTMLLQVHDELVFEVKEDRLGEAETLIKRAMEQAAGISVPLVVDIGHGSHWGEAH
jgi:DNA polymerase I